MSLKVDVTQIFSFDDPKKDPDKLNSDLGQTHCELWSSKGKLGTLKWNPNNQLKTTIGGVEFVFTPDSITNGFVHSHRKTRLGKREFEVIHDYSPVTQQLVKKYQDTDYTIGSSLIFPIAIGGVRLRWTMNIARGISYAVHDRIDYTLECIKRWYEHNDDNPLKKAIDRSADFFNLFSGFEEYVDFSLLNDLIDSEGHVKSFTGTIDFQNPFPQTEEEYCQYLQNTMDFVDKRNKRIDEWAKSH